MSKKSKPVAGGVEDQIKELVKKEYGSILQFTTKAGLPYATFDSMLKRGFNNSTVENVIKVCNALHISADELSKGHIVPIIVQKKDEGPTDILGILAITRNRLLSCDGLTFNGEPADPESVQSILDAMEIGVGMALKKKEARSIDTEDSGGSDSDI